MIERNRPGIEHRCACGDLFTGGGIRCPSCRPRRQRKAPGWAMCEVGPGGIIRSDDPRREAVAESAYADDPRGSNDYFTRQPR